MMSKTGEAHARTGDLFTSHVAAAAVRGDKANRLEGIVVAALRAAPDGLTWDEAAAATGVDKGSISPRWKPLRKKGLITSRLDPATGKEKRRRSQIVWYAVAR